MKNFALLLFFICFLSGCKDNDDIIIIPACGVVNPLQGLEWLKTEINRRNQNLSEDMKYCYIVQAEYNGETVFAYADCNPLVNKAIPVLNCEGVSPNTQSNPIPFDDLQNKRIIWKGNNFVCEVSF